MHGVPYNDGDPLELARGAATARGAPTACGVQSSGFVFGV